jgi:C4-type Zn-finger protein
MICPACSSAECRRSRRRTRFDYVASVLGYIPWRCSRCSKRFRSRATPFANLLSAHCSICGNIELKRISPELAEGFGAPLWRSLSVPAFRCIPCRHKFFSVLPLSKQVQDSEYKIAS